MKILLDQGLPRSTASILRDAGLDAIHAGEIGMAIADDSAILEHARMNDCAVVTLDADFHQLLAHSGAAKPTVLRIRIEGLRGAQCAEIILRTLKQCAQDVEHGAVLSITARRVRLRRLPLTKRQ